ncbi:unnamed protein product [Acanthosepion pharaonis]|uniref:Uncharacterized protein n=1 Tax=Acanthosepion pharaonis TaxID=158019 RepID=A0A812DXC6_ACAPH|nr:unnamed protein product [Sepia pharaonis]
MAGMLAALTIWRVIFLRGSSMRRYPRSGSARCLPFISGFARDEDHRHCAQMRICGPADRFIGAGPAWRGRRRACPTSLMLEVLSDPSRSRFSSPARQRHDPRLRSQARRRTYPIPAHSWPPFFTGVCGTASAPLRYSSCDGCRPITPPRSPRRPQNQPDTISNTRDGGQKRPSSERAAQNDLAAARARTVSNTPRASWRTQPLTRILKRNPRQIKDFRRKRRHLRSRRLLGLTIQTAKLLFPCSGAVFFSSSDDLSSRFRSV